MAKNHEKYMEFEKIPSPFINIRKAGLFKWNTYWWSASDEWVLSLNCIIKSQKFLVYIILGNKYQCLYLYWWQAI